MRNLFILLYSLCFYIFSISITYSQTLEDDFEQTDDSIHFLSNGIIEYRSHNGEIIIGIYGKQLIKSNQCSPYGGHQFSGDNSNNQTNSTNSGMEMGDGNHAKGDLKLAFRTFYRNFANDILPYKITLDFIKTDFLWRSRPIDYANNSDENALSNTGRQVGPEYEGSIEVGAKFKEIHLTIKGGRFKVFGENPLYETTDDLAHGGRPFGIDEASQHGDGIQFRIFTGFEENPDLEISMTGFDSATPIGQKRPSKTLEGKINVAGKVHAKLSQFLPADLAKSLSQYVGEMSFSLSGVINNKDLEKKQQSVIGVIGTAKKVASGTLKLRLLIGQTDRHSFKNSKMNRTFTKTFEIGYLFKSSFNSQWSLNTLLFFNYTHSKNMGKGIDELWKVPNANRVKIFQGGVQFGFKNTDSFLDNLKFLIVAGSSQGCSKEFGGDPNELFGMFTIEIDFFHPEKIKSDQQSVNSQKEMPVFTDAPKYYQSRVSVKDHEKVKSQMAREDCFKIFEELDSWWSNGKIVYELLERRSSNQINYIKREFKKLYGNIWSDLKAAIISELSGKDKMRALKALENNHR